MKKTVYPRNGQYEIFIHLGRVLCLDDPDWNIKDESEDIHTWIRSQAAGWYNMETPHDRVAYYLDPKLYMLFKLKFS